MWKVMVDNGVGLVPKRVGMWVEASDAVHAVNRAREILVKDYGILMPSLGKAKWVKGVGEEGTCDGGVYAEGWDRVDELERASFSQMEVGILYGSFRTSGAYVIPDWVLGAGEGNTWFDIHKEDFGNKWLDFGYQGKRKEILFGVLPELVDFEGCAVFPSGVKVGWDVVNKAREWAVAGLLNFKAGYRYWTRNNAV